MIRIENVRQDRGTDWFEQTKVADAPPNDWDERGDENPVERLENPLDERADKCPAALATLVAVTYGRLVYWIGERKIILEKGDFLYLPPHTAYYAKSIPSVFHEKYVVTFALSEDARRIPLFGDAEPAHARQGMYEWMIERLRTMQEEWSEQTPFAALRAEAILCELAVLWSRDRLREPAAPSSTRMAERMKDYVASHYRERVTKDELGACIGRTPNHAAALFKRVTGQTISAYVHAARIKTAVYLLSDSLLTVAEIAEYLGYRDVSYFQRIFKRTTGRTPTDYMSRKP
ncbi:AraC family transcriptional regulator [Cohnella sp. REN36]|uniref:helix-turn-helix domain-containing protein n=1 Tax=Cohnella sp. REN36 TaxID=2887347 RepID=UPI001D1469C9|nr:AraC family transcriptional regulator [Cohnella sp. REN36]MCC3371734.1 AraC family transcriptional regulator [Cohnella sp. REN36]